ncbi:MAG TPA: transcriptional regulator [Candidatus Thermoplasmatota archaeon]|nr:transcriptional regulator [Candidatus Thermoplasmatota archaeon]
MIVDPVCGMEFTEEEAETLGAERLVKDGKTIWFCSPACKHEYAKRG